MLDCLIHWDGWNAVTAIATCVAAFTAVVAALYAAFQFSSFQRENRISHLIELLHEFEDKAITNVRQRLAYSRLKQDVLTDLDVERPP
jgi:hypothetical protein